MSSHSLDDDAAVAALVDPEHLCGAVYEAHLSANNEADGHVVARVVRITALDLLDPVRKDELGTQRVGVLLDTVLDVGVSEDLQH